MTFDYELSAEQKGYKRICGIDEAGRGPLAGPVSAAAVILPFGIEIPGLNDSKKLTEAKREVLFDIICSKAISYAVAMVSPKEIDEINILQATFLAMKNACEQIECDYALIDGNQFPPINIPGETIVKGDGLSPSIAAASILAKVSRDRLMYQYDKQYPNYGFAKHKGYGTKTHSQAILDFGPCEIHRATFLKKLLRG